LAEHYIPADVRIIDLAQDFRLANDEHDYVYGLPELNALQLQGAQHIANPGCFATCIQLALLPLAAAGLLDGDVMVNAITGSTGAGVKPSATTHFSWRSGNMSIYKAFEHQHVPEILQSLHKLQPSFDGAIDFIPYRGDFPRGIFCTAVVRQEVELEQVVRLYKEFYADAVFTHYVDRPIDMKQVVGTNKCLVHVDVHGDKILVTSCIDNLLKGASGQAVQNMNLMFGLEENCGLQLKSLAF
jgi:N-acetyl-gamma-glutamyl-phosphate reductase